tara:strand:- start:245 stop:568 length:324 start_codon:yes stop_codon:yes gene_type:complete
MTSSRTKTIRRSGTKKRYPRNKHNSKRGKGTKKHYSRKNKDTKLTKQNWMKKLIFTGGNGAAEHGVNVFGGMGNQHVGNGGAIHVNQLSTAPVIPDIKGGQSIEPAV